MLEGKKILLGITGSIAAYKAAILCRLLIKNGFEVKVIFTPSAKDFITPLTLSTLSGHPVVSELTDGNSWHNHVELGLWADVMVIAPCTASTLAKMASGICDNMLLACYLSAKCPVFIAPAMDLDMWNHPATVNNINSIISYKNNVIPVGTGFLASGLYGDGRMAEPEEIIHYLTDFFSREKDLLGKNILITAGPTYEKIDPVRFISNRSSGKMGYALAEECINRGAHVTLISGPTNIKTESEKIKVVNVLTANEMYLESKRYFEDSDIIILAAAVADYTPSVVSDTKIKKSDDSFSLNLKKTVDIAATLGKIKQKNQLMVGFALETNNEIQNALKKLHTKNLDFIVLNTLNDSGAGFQFETNKITILDTFKNVVTFPLKTKIEVATDIVNYIVNFHQL
ncbi:MAG: bifunctional phosphopantothenoylcysteine decarboxylase/phosphopantothenate--cysteine ligase CoaBC [Saprospiraceae bacterium]|jgi:phosphopantothenoylcysteine decarboxylase/phosphopantothenate--cysteine ligase|nr:bifunctional phosphopantothenoylcysteine decarboxylase/phosphopantothenate--cysteine ligase CoaBC [Saprospiraceae bacterium]MBL0026641.1 bifunctional phosphopantothenoylcysteine decarboxylase/phosphopantothenate--cysteine ligase CoaBC [Saprospiraceae bacterium]